MNGKTCTIRIREFERKQKISNGVVVIALTGVNSAQGKQDALDAGMNRFFTKPIRMRDLSALVEEVRAELPQ
jgi:CheY-like chemotaxis protein